MLVTLCVLALGTSPNNIVQSVVHNHHVSYDGYLFIGNNLVEIPVEYNTSSTASIFPRAAMKSLPGYVYNYRMVHLSPITTATLASSINYALVAPANLNEISLILNVYKTDYVFLGAPPVEILPHLQSPICPSTLPTFTSGLDFTVTGGSSNASAIVRHSVDRHTISDTSFCGTSVIYVSGVPINVWIDCSSAVSGTTNVLSGYLLKLGIYKSPSTFCIYQSNNDEINHVMAIAIVVIMFIFLTVWIDWTNNLWVRILTKRTKGIWETITVAYSLIVYQYIVIIVSMNIYARIQKSHNIYNFSTMRMLTQQTVDATAYVYSYIVTPIIGGLCLAVMSLGNIKYGPEFHEKPFYFTWGIDRLTETSVFFRIVVTLFILGSVAVIIWAIWIHVLNNRNGAYATAITTLPTVLHWSTPHWLTQQLKNVNLEHMDAVLIFFAWGIKFITVTCLCNNLPFDVSGHLNTTFHSAISFSLGSALLIITGRDMAHMTMFIGRMRSTMMYFSLLFLHVLVAFVLWYLSIFNLGGMFSHSGALRNRGPLAALCSCTFSYLIFALSFSVCIDDGITNINKRR